MDLKDYSKEELEKELERKNKEENKPPEELDNFHYNLEGLRDLARDLMAYLAGDDDKYIKDIEYKIFEKVMEVFYGEDVFDWMNKQEEE